MRTVKEIIKVALDNAKKANANFSMRSLAMHLEISPGYLSKILNGKKNFPQDKLDKVCKVLKIDNLTRDELEIALSISKLSTERQETIKHRIKDSGKLTFSQNYEEKGIGDYWLIEKWYRFQIRNLLRLRTFAENPSLIAIELGIKPLTLEKTLKQLKERNYIKYLENGHIEIIEKNLRFTNVNFNYIARDFQESNLQLARKELVENTSPESFKNRLISNNTFAVHSSQVEAFRNELKEMCYRIVQKYDKKELPEGEDKDSLYQLNYQFFPISYKGHRLLKQFENQTESSQKIS